ncbi:acyl-CoA thioesterase [Aurantivibrio plasticivorans]
MNHPMTTLIRIRYGECDAQQVVFNARYADYVDAAMTEYMRHVHGGPNKLLERGLDNQVVKMTTQWRSSAVFDDTIAITTETVHIGNTSFTLMYKIFDYPTGILRATCEMVYVMVDSTDYKKHLIPEDIRQQLERGAPGVVINFAAIDFSAETLFNNIEEH